MKRFFFTNYNPILIALILLHIFFSGIFDIAIAQITPPLGLRQNNVGVFALTNAKIVTSPGKIIRKGSLVIRNGIIESVGAKINIPKDATILDMSGMTLYPGLIESYSNIGFPELKKDKKSDRKNGGAKHWNENVTPELISSGVYTADLKKLKEFRKLGFTTALSVPREGIFKGQSALVTLGDGESAENILKNSVVQHVTFSKKKGISGYPTSLMGAISLIRQTFYDAEWYKKAMSAYSKKPSLGKPDESESLAALVSVIDGKGGVMFEAFDELMVLRIDKIVKEFKLKPLILASGNEFKRLSAVKKTGISLILPLNFPEPPDVKSPEKALEISLKKLKEWDLAPSNPAMLSNAGVKIALTTYGLKKLEDFPKQLRKAISRGLSKESALAALTTHPAEFFGVSDKLGTLKKGKIANIVVTDGDLFSKDGVVKDVWIAGKRYAVEKDPNSEPKGKWTGTISFNAKEPKEFSLELKGSNKKLSGTATISGKELKLMTVEVNRYRIAFSFLTDSVGIGGITMMTGKVKTDEMNGVGVAPGYPNVKWNLLRENEDEDEEESDDDEKFAAATAQITYPLGGFGRPNLPKRQKTIFVKNATIWTSGKEGILENADMLIKNGKISKVGKNLKVPKNALIIDGTGKHVTPGLIDEHSHTAMTGGVNEAGQAVTSEVRIGDVLTGDNIALYRELAGGLTMSQELHGSANPIGGQAAVIKIRYGSLPEDLKYSKAAPTIKFALGENVKQSNWNPSTLRYPRTRMGVEQIFRDEFRAGLDYKAALRSKKGLPVRKDLELDAIVDIMEGKMFVHCHSYRQDEILMLMRVAEDFGFRIQTFTHILEGYKVADEMKKHGASASTFSDWWSYKFEVYDAIPYNGTLMHDVGLVTSFNSDSDELSRRMNLEAAKAVAYGGVSEEEALKFVTINPAIQLKIDKWTGSLEVGKDGDFVVWNGSPLSTLTIAEQTWIDGAKWFDIEEDAKLRVKVMKEREKLIQKILSSSSDKKGKNDKSIDTEEEI
ncbi:MAG: amidohydrolase family protein [Candidatus Marinimicrobia bacterium]|nr:amidohydrolase family protein [Candidatus Neomarinimicrobiota bacterium]